MFATTSNRERGIVGKTSTHGGLVLLTLLAALGLSGSATARVNLEPLTGYGVTSSTYAYTQVEPKEDEPAPPAAAILWKTPDAIKLEWWDNSEVETGYALEQEVSSGRWEEIASFPALPGDYLTQTHVIRGLSPETRYCFRMVAYNARGDSEAVDYASDCTTTTAPGSCDETVMESLLQLAHDGARSVRIRCNLTLEPAQVVTKTLELVGKSASHLTVDLNGAVLNAGPGTYNEGRDALVIRSEEVVEDLSQRISEYERPEGIVVKNGEIRGAVRIFGMAANGQGDPEFENLWVCRIDTRTNTYQCGYEKHEKPRSNQLKKSSWLADHTQRARANAPTDVLLEGLTIIGFTRVPLYIAPGVTYTTLQNSTVFGRSAGPAIYLDAESGYNVIRDNSIDVDTKGTVTTIWDRPAIAIDGSSHNQILNNRFSNLKNGGIFLYRNCGEGGVIRHNTPSYNHIVNNVFYYVGYDGDNPAIYLASRDRGFEDDLSPWGFCSDDDGYPYGSSASDKDYARHNVVMQNQIFERSLYDAIRVKNSALNSPNSIFRNETVTASTVDWDRPADCTWELAEGDYVAHGDAFDEMESSCVGTRYLCEDGRLEKEPFSSLCGYETTYDAWTVSEPESDFGGTLFGVGTSTLTTWE